MKNHQDPLVRTNIYLPASTLAKLADLSRNTHTPVAGIVRAAVDAYLKERTNG